MGRTKRSQRRDEGGQATAPIAADDDPLELPSPTVAQRWRLAISGVLFAGWLIWLAVIAVRT